MTLLKIVTEPAILIITIFLFLGTQLPIFVDAYRIEKEMISYDPTCMYYIILYIQMLLLPIYLYISALLNKLFTKKSLKGKH